MELPFDLEKVEQHLRPQHDRVIIWREPIPKKTGSGLLIPDTVEVEMEMSNLRTGIIVAVGDGRWNPMGDVRSPMTLKAGDRVMFHKHAGERIYVFGECFQIMGDGDVGVVVQKDTPIELVYAQIAAKG